MSDTVRDLPRLEQEERAISQRRRRLHERIDFIQGGGFADSGDQERLARLQAEEREVSRQRHELHERIDALRAQVGNQSAGGAGVAPPRERLEKPSTDYMSSLHRGTDPLPPRNT